MANYFEQNLIFFKFSQTYIIRFIKLWGFQICAYFFSSFSDCSVFSHFVIFNYIKVAKHIWNPCSHLAAEDGGWFPLIEGWMTASLSRIDQGILTQQECYKTFFFVTNREAKKQPNTTFLCHLINQY